MAKKKQIIPTIDPAALQVLQIAEEQNISTVFSRAAAITPCPIGSDGACCKICSMGPCRLVGRTTRGVCGATLATVAARNYARMCAGGASAHSDHGRDLAFTLIGVGEGTTDGYEIKDVAKLHQVAGFMGISTEGREVNEIALDVGNMALQQFGQQRGEIVFTARATEKRQKLWRELGIMPRGIDREVVETLHRTHEGADLDPEHILDQAMRTALGDGWGGSLLATYGGQALGLYEAGEGAGFIGAVVGAIILLVYGAWQGIEEMIGDASLPWYIKTALLALLFGLVVLLVSVIREKLFLGIRQRYKDVER